jgi:hypothetical protein
MSKELIITIQKDLFPKLFDHDDEKLNKLVIFLINIGYQHTYSSISQENIINKVDGICRKFKDDILNGIQDKNQIINTNINKLDTTIQNLNIDNKIEEFNDVIHNLFGISSTSSKKGEISEDLIYKIINEKYPNYTLDIKRHIPHHADGELQSPSGMKCLVEIKNYSNTVNKDEIVKFKYDLKHTNNKLGIFLSLKTGIVGKKCIDYEVFKHNNENYHIIYISRLMDDINKLDCGILLLENLNNIIKKDNVDLKIEQIKKMIYENFTNLEGLINKTSDLRNNFSKLENNIKSNLDFYYKDLREYELDLKEKMQKVWISLFNDLQDIDINFVDEKEKILLSYGKDKCYLILSKLFDILNNKQINIKGENDSDNNYNLFYKNNNIGYIKKMKGKVLFYLEKIKLSITLSEKDEDIDKNLEFIVYAINNII